MSISCITKPYLILCCLVLSGCIATDKKRPSGGEGTDFRGGSEDTGNARPDLTGVDYSGQVQFLKVSFKQDASNTEPEVDSPIKSMTKGYCHTVPIASDLTEDKRFALSFTSTKAGEEDGPESEHLSITTASPGIPATGYIEDFGGESDLVFETSDSKTFVPNKNVFLKLNNPANTFLTNNKENPSRCRLEVLENRPVEQKDFPKAPIEDVRKFYPYWLKFSLNCERLYEQTYYSSYLRIQADIKCLAKDGT